MNKSLIWITAGVAGIGFALPAYAAMSSHTTGPITTPATTVASTPKVEAGDDRTITTTASTPSMVSLPAVTVDDSPDATTAISVDDHGSCVGEDANDDRCTGIDDADDADDSDDSANTTSNSVEDVSGPCDEAEHANDPRCTSTSATSGSDDNSASNSGRGSGHSGSDDNSGGHNSGHGGSNDG